MGESLTGMNDLALVCPTCHRVLHKHRPIITPAASGEETKREISRAHRLKSVPAWRPAGTNSRMGNTVVDQIAPDGTLLHDVDTTISQKRRHDLILDALPGATIEQLAGAKVVV